MPHKWRHWLTWRQGPQPPRACARARRRARARAVHSDVGNVSSQMPHLRGIAQSATWCPNAASLAHVASGRARWRGRTWRQNLASLAHVASGSQDVASGSQVASQDVASKCGVTCLPTWRQKATCGRRSSASAHASGLTRRRRTTWRQNVASPCRPVLRRILYWVLFSDQVQNSRVPLFCSWTPLGPGARTGAGIAIVLQHECSKNYLSFGRGKRAGAASQSQSAHAEHMFHANLSHVVHSVCGSGYMGLPRQILRARHGAALSQNARAEHELHANLSHIAH